MTKTDKILAWQKAFIKGDHVEIICDKNPNAGKCGVVQGPSNRRSHWVVKVGNNNWVIQGRHLKK